MPHIFSSLNRATGQIDLIKADTRGQVTKFLAANFVVQRADPLQVAEAMSKGAKLLDATGIQTDKSDSQEGGAADTLEGTDGLSVQSGGGASPNTYTAPNQQ